VKCGDLRRREKAMKTGENHVLYYEDGEVVFEKDSIGSDMYIIESGEVEISLPIRDRKTTLVVLGKGSLFGEMALFTSASRSATATAIGMTTLRPFTREEALQLMQEDSQFAVTILQTLIGRLRTTNSILKVLIAKLYDLSDIVMEGFIPKRRPMKIGQILIEMDCLTKIQLERSLQRQKEMREFQGRDKLVGEIMMDSGIITKEQLRNALAEQQLAAGDRDERDIDR
jgi:CRP-like cAMP-binding protein